MDIVTSAIKFHSPAPSLNISFRYTPSPYYRFKIRPQGVLWLKETSLLPQIKLVSNHSWPLTLGSHCFWINTHYVPERFKVPAGGLAPQALWPYWSDTSSVPGPQLTAKLSHSLTSTHFLFLLALPSLAASPKSRPTKPCLVSLVLSAFCAIKNKTWPKNNLRKKELV